MLDVPFWDFESWRLLLYLRRPFILVVHFFQFLVIEAPGSRLDPDPDYIWIRIVVFSLKCGSGSGSVSNEYGSATLNIPFLLPSHVPYYCRRPTSEARRCIWWWACSCSSSPASTWSCWRSTAPRVECGSHQTYIHAVTLGQPLIPSPASNTVLATPCYG